MISNNFNNYPLITDPKVLAISIIENNESMVDLKNEKDILYGSSPEIPDNTDYTKLRRTVYEKLKQSQKLLPEGLHLCLYEGFRSLQLQKILFGNRFDKIQKLYPDWTHKKIFIETTKLVSPVINQNGSKNIPPHSTGGAFDIYLVNYNGDPVEMGIHPKDWMEDNSGETSATFSNIVSREAVENRKIMYNALSAVGFVNYPTEYWHWSYGDRYWAYYQNQSHAIYGCKHDFNS